MFFAITTTPACAPWSRPFPRTTASVGRCHRQDEEAQDANASATQTQFVHRGTPVDQSHLVTGRNDDHKVRG